MYVLCVCLYLTKYTIRSNTFYNENVSIICIFILYTG